jgi:hypothetical protein
MSVLCLAACAELPPFRNIAATSSEDCAEVYKAVDASTDPQAAIGSSLERSKEAHCWSSAWERHPDYDLFTVEFDDQGWLAGAAAEPAAAARQITQLMGRLQELVESKKWPQPLSVVLYTHGWHHSASPADSNVIAFRKLLADMVTVEKELCVAKRDPKLRSSVDCTVNEPGVVNTSKVRRVLGIYVGWRGDSIRGPLIRHASIWDRKLAAEKVALGSVQELYASIHDFWRYHACHLETKFRPDCVDVRLLTIGHSFGGLITYRGLAPRLMSGIVERHRGFQLKEGEIPYAYGFGDLSVLINPAFEGSRFEALARAASLRAYEAGKGTGGPKGRTAQLPFLVIAQSRGDAATHYAFPLFRHVTTLFERTVGEEADANIKTVGWNRRYVTHELTLRGTKDECGSPPDAGIQQKLSAEAGWSERHLGTRFAEFDSAELRFCHGLVLRKSPDDASANPLARPAVLPLWVLQTDTHVIEDHADFLNTHFVDFVRQLYYAIQRATDRYLRTKD